MCAFVRAERPDVVVHLGDHARDAAALAQRFPELPLLRVPGNCDGITGLLDTLVQQYAGVTVFMTHGHRYGVKQGLLRLSLAAREMGAQIALFGHTHRPLCLCEGGLWLLNPGSCPDHGAASCGVVELHDGQIDCRLLTVER